MTTGSTDHKDNSDRETPRIFNFSAGPAVLPEEVLLEARDNLLSLGRSGLGVLEISHRSKDFEAIMDEAEKNLRDLLGLRADQRVLFLSGGATTQFSMVPMNLLDSGGPAGPSSPGRTADYVITGEWSKKALVEARRVGGDAVKVAATTEETRFRRVPRNDELRFSERPAYVHTTSNNTIWGTQWHWEPETAGHPLVCDMSSDFLSRPIDAARYGLIYAGAQKNAGPAGVTMVIIKDELLALGGDKSRLPIMMNYKTHIDGKSLYNTPPVFPIYVVHLVLRWLKKQGGLSAMARHNQEKAAHIYRVIDEMPEFYRGHAEENSRSLMNITFRLPYEGLDDRFVKEARAQGMDGLKGHRSAGGLRASVYNAFPLSGAAALASFMRDFAQKNG